jgi:TatA/E family protein of Tat protein translocase
MGEFSIFHWLVVLAIVLILFGGRKIPEVMKGLGEGIRNFKDGMAGAQAASTASTSASTPLGAPGGLSAKPGSGQVSLHWGAAFGAATYNVKRSGTSGGPYARIASVAETAYTDADLVAGTTFYYVVSATNASVESENSLEVSATIA